MERGFVFNIERYAVHDGPGIRTLIFLSGCPLRCLWCQNPEGFNKEPQLIFFSNKCTKCLQCISVCPNNAIYTLNNEVKTDLNLCMNCLKCTEVCSFDARKRTSQLMTSLEVVDEVVKDLAFYRNSGGGITLTGGEPLMQPEFAAEILKICKERNISTAIETSGYAEWNKAIKVFKYTDFVYFDIKHTNPQRHKAGTGVSNKLIIENLEKLANLEKEIVIRVPIIPNFNDSTINISNTCRLINRLKTIKKIELLPYHKLGVSKYERLGRKYSLNDVDSPKDEVLIKIKSIVESFNLECNIL